MDPAPRAPLIRGAYRIANDYLTISVRTERGLPMNGYDNLLTP